MIDIDKAILTGEMFQFFEKDTGFQNYCLWCMRTYKKQIVDVLESPITEAYYKSLQPGEWIYRRGDKYSCSKCGTTTSVDESGIEEKPMYRFCPYCGADMRGAK